MNAPLTAPPNLTLPLPWLTLSTGAQGLRATLRLQARPDETDPDVLHIRASDETLDRYEEIIAAEGWQLEAYRKNPVVQNAHNYHSVLDTIGRAERTWVAEGALQQVWRFAAKENPLAKVARDLYRGGFLKAASVGFIPLRWENGGPDAGYRRKYLEQELIEVSAVSVPANPNALALAVKSGAVGESDLKDLADLLQSLCASASLREAQTLSPPTPAENEGDPRAQASVLQGAQWKQLNEQLNQIRALLRRAHP